MDLDVYTEMAVARPNQVAAILIRDVSTPASSSVNASTSATTVRAPQRSATALSGTSSSSASTASTSNEPDPSTLAWHARLVRASQALPSNVVLQTWREGGDVQNLCEYLVKSLQGSERDDAS